MHVSHPSSIESLHARAWVGIVVIGTLACAEAEAHWLAGWHFMTQLIMD